MNIAAQEADNWQATNKGDTQTSFSSPLKLRLAAVVSSAGSNCEIYHICSRNSSSSSRKELLGLCFSSFLLFRSTILHATINRIPFTGSAATTAATATYCTFSLTSILVYTIATHAVMVAILFTNINYCYYHCFKYDCIKWRTTATAVTVSFKFLHTFGLVLSIIQTTGNGRFFFKTWGVMALHSFLSFITLSNVSYI